MTNRRPYSPLKRLLIGLPLCLALSAAWADEYSDVSQLLRVGKLKEALTQADQYLASRPADAQMRFIKGVIQRDSGKMTEAIATFTRLTEDYPELPEPYNNLAVIYAGQNQYDKARAALEMAVRTNPRYAVGHENLGDIYAKLASESYARAAQLDSANTALPGKLAMLRELFGPKEVQAAQPVPTPTAPPVVSAEPVAKSVVSAGKGVVPTGKAVVPVAEASDSMEVRAVEAAVRKWASAWSERNVKDYLASYGKDFEPDSGLSRQDWEAQRQQRISSKSSISVKVNKLSVSIQDKSATAKFQQDYKAGSFSQSNRKALAFEKVGDQWLIVKESASN